MDPGRVTRTLDKRKPEEDMAKEKFEWTAVREYRHHGSHRPRQDHAHGGHHQGLDGLTVTPPPPSRTSTGAGKAHDITCSYRGVRDENRHYAHVAARSRRLHQEHDHRAAQVDGAILVAQRGRRPHAPDARARAVRPPGRRPPRGRLTSRTWSTTRNFEFAELEARTLNEYEFPATTSSCTSRPSRPRRLRRRRRQDHGARGSTGVPEPERELDKLLLMPIEDVFSITGRGTVVTKVEQGVVNVGDALEIVGIKDTQTTTCTGDVQAPRHRLRPATTSSCCVVSTRKRSSVQVLRPGRSPPHRVRGAGLRPHEGRGYVTSRSRELSPAVLLPDHRSPARHPPSWHRCMLGDNTEMTWS